MGFKSGERAGHFRTFKFLSWSVLMFVAGNCHVEKWLHHLQICHTAERDTGPVFQYNYFSEFCFPSKKTSSDEPREEMAAQTITEPPPKFLLKMFFGALWHRSNNIYSHLKKITESQFISKLTSLTGSSYEPPLEVVGATLNKLQETTPLKASEYIYVYVCMCAMY